MHAIQLWEYSGRLSFLASTLDPGIIGSFNYFIRQAKMPRVQATLYLVSPSGFPVGGGNGEGVTVHQTFPPAIYVPPLSQSRLQKNFRISAHYIILCFKYSESIFSLITFSHPQSILAFRPFKKVKGKPCLLIMPPFSEKYNKTSKIFCPLSVHENHQTYIQHKCLMV